MGYIFKNAKPENPERWLKANQIIEQFNHHAAHQSLLLSLHFSVSHGRCIVQEKTYIFFCWKETNGGSEAPWKALGRIHRVEEAREKPSTSRLRSPSCSMLWRTLTDLLENERCFSVASHWETWGYHSLLSSIVSPCSHKRIAAALPGTLAQHRALLSVPASWGIPKTEAFLPEGVPSCRVDGWSRILAPRTAWQTQYHLRKGSVSLPTQGLAGLEGEGCTFLLFPRLPSLKVSPPPPHLFAYWIPFARTWLQRTVPVACTRRFEM